MSVDQYISNAPAAMQSLLIQLRADILASAPAAEETISYNIPTYKCKGTLVHFAAFRNHCSFIVVNKEVLITLKQELSAFKISGTTIHMTPENPLPSPLVKKIIKIRIRQNQNLVMLEARAAKNKKASELS